MNTIPPLRLRLCIVAGLMSGCADIPTVGGPGSNASTSAEPVLCVSKTQCDVYWQRAQAFVANNSAYRLQTISDTVIETAGPATARTGLAFRVTRVPDNQEGARIYVVAACGNAVGCSPASSDAVIAFKRFVIN
jgi:hypothetical protein